MRMQSSNRREFLQQSGATLAIAGLGKGHSIARASEVEAAVAKRDSAFRTTEDAALTAKQEERRKELWSLLGELPTQHVPGPPKVVGTEKHEGYTLERLVMDLNGMEPVPALLLIPDKRPARAPGLLYIHWHGGMYDLGKEQFLVGVKGQPAYAPVCVEKGLVTLAIDSWCFGGRKHDENGSRGEEDTFKYMLWNGRVLWGMM